MKQPISDALPQISKTENNLTPYSGQKLLPAHPEEREPPKAFVRLSQGLAFTYLLFITWLAMHHYRGAPHASDLTASFIIAFAPPGAALLLLPFVPVPGFVLRALRRAQPRVAGPRALPVSSHQPMTGART